VSDRLADLLTEYAERLHQRDLQRNVAVVAVQPQDDAYALTRYYERRALFELMHYMEWHPGEPYVVAAHRMLKDFKP
jgi:hypothetical protein